jgi:hypothetical protein
MTGGSALIVTVCHQAPSKLLAAFEKYHYDTRNAVTGIFKFDSIYIDEH